MRATTTAGQVEKAQPAQANNHHVKYNLQDKENINNLVEMSGGQYKRELIEKVYLMNSMNFEKTLDQILNGSIPKDEYKVIDVDQQKEMVNTSTTQKKQNSELLQQYTLGAFEGSKARTQKNRKYYQEHLKAMESIK